MKLLRTYDDEILSEVADRLDDRYMKDFEPQEYAMQCFKAERSIAADYQILERTYNVEVEDEDEE